MDLDGSKGGKGKERVYRAMTRGHNWAMDISMEANMNRCQPSKIREGLVLSPSADANIGQMVSGSVICLSQIHSPPTEYPISAIRGNYISQAPLPTGLANERHWGEGWSARGGERPGYFSVSLPASGEAQAPPVVIPLILVAAKRSLLCSRIAPARQPLPWFLPEGPGFWAL